MKNLAPASFGVAPYLELRMEKVRRVKPRGSNSYSVALVVLRSNEVDSKGADLLEFSCYGSTQSQLDYRKLNLNFLDWR